MNRGCFALSALTLLIALAPTGAVAAPAYGAPELNVYLFVLDGLDRDAVTEDGSAPFLAGLIAGESGDAADRATFFPRSRSVMLAETNPNHTSMVTGAFPKRTGIVGNEFAVYGPTPDDDSCSTGPIDTTSAPTATSGENRFCPRAENVFAAIDRQPDADDVTTALIMGKPKLARLFATQTAGPGNYDADYIWAPCQKNEDYCEEVPAQPITGYALTDEIVMDEVIETTIEGVGPNGERPDFTFANFPVIDSAGHYFGGRSGAAYTIGVGLADAQIERFVENQKALGIWDRTVMMVVSDHSMSDTPPGSQISLAGILGDGGIPDDAYTIIGNGTAAHIYLNDRTDPARDALLRRMRAALMTEPAILDVVYRRPNPADGDTAHMIPRGWGLGGSRSGDIVITTREGSGVLETSEVSPLPFNPLTGNHGSTTTRDNFWLIAGGSPLVRQGISQRRISNANAAATVTHLLGRKAPADAQAAWVRQAFADELAHGKPKAKIP